MQVYQWEWSSSSGDSAPHLQDVVLDMVVVSFWSFCEMRYAFTHLNDIVKFKKRTSREGPHTCWAKSANIMIGLHFFVSTSGEGVQPQGSCFFLPHWSDLILLCQSAEHQMAMVGLIPALPFISFKMLAKVLKIAELSSFPMGLITFYSKVVRNRDDVCQDSVNQSP